MKKRFSAYVLSVLTVAIFSIIGCDKKDDTNTDGEPIACINSATTATVGQSVSFSSCSTGGDTYLWEFSDGSNQNSTSANTTHTFTATGSYSVTLTVTNEKGSNTTSVIVTVTSGSSATSGDYVGNYNTTSSCGGTPFTYTLTVAANGANAITIDNLSNLGQNLGTVNATINGLVVTIPQQQPSGSAFTVNGSGTLSNNKKTLNLSYTVSDGGSQSVCTSNGTKP